MLFHSVRFKNYKSMGDYDLNELIIEPQVTTIVGKNESGKSNILDGLSRISFTKNMSSAFSADNVNRNNSTDAEIQYIIVLQFTKAEKESYGVDDDTIVSITKEGYSFTGGIVKYFNGSIKDLVLKLLELLGDNPFKIQGQDLSNYKNKVNSLQQTNSLDIKLMNDAINYIAVKISRSQLDKKELAISAFEELQQAWNGFVRLIPVVFYRDADKMLKSQYKFDDVKKELDAPTSYPNSLLPEFVRLIQISKEDFLSAVQGGVSGCKAAIRKQIQKNVNCYINIPFCAFYNVEPIKLSIDFDSNIVYFSVQSSNGESLLLSERSNGLRWYLNAFIDSRANDIPNANVLYLFDEPGTSLHINAQKELINLFEDLCIKGNQIVYTTHSPFMLNTNQEGIQRIRAVTKDTQGFTYIYKTAYDSRIAPESQKDTLTPIINAIGMSLSDTFGPAQNKINIVCEGISDYIYFYTISTFLKLYLDEINIIPALGVTNCVNICNILYGWNCPFVALFDFDKEGVEKGGEKMERSGLYKYGENYLYLVEVNQDMISSKEYKNNPYMIEDLIGREFLKSFIKINKLPEDSDVKHKTLLAKMLCDSLLSESLALPVDCIARISALLGQILSHRN